MTRAVLTCFHNYTYMMDHKYYAPIFDYFMKNFKEVWYDEVDKLYILDSTWDAKFDDPKVEIIKVPDPSTRYYDVYKWFLPKVKEKYVMFMDNDMVVTRKGVVDSTFKKLDEGYDVVSIYDTIGKMMFEELGMKSKFCPYWFAVKTATLMKFRYREWGPNMPEHETLGDLTMSMLGEGLKPFEIEEDKTDEGKGLGYYHIRNGSLAAYLLTTKHFGDVKTYKDYIKHQPASETLRLCTWYDKMGGDTTEIRNDLAEEVTRVNREIAGRYEEEN